MADEATDAPDGPAKQDEGKPTSWPARLLTVRGLLLAAGGAVALLALLLVGAYVWKVVAVRALEARLLSERGESSEAKRQALSVQARDLLRLTARPLAWAVRAEMLRGNLDAVDDYFREFVRERGVTSLLLVGKDGRIALATNRKLETQPAETVVSKALLEASDVTSEESGTSFRLAVPIMGLDSRLGLLVVDYDTQGK
jgi:Arc/MetJ family transcription regulator